MKDPGDDEYNGKLIYPRLLHDAQLSEEHCGGEGRERFPCVHLGPVGAASPALGLLQEGARGVVVVAGAELGGADPDVGQSGGGDEAVVGDGHRIPLGGAPYPRRTRDAMRARTENLPGRAWTQGGTGTDPGVSGVYTGMLLMLIACNRAPPAPQELNELAAWLFQHIEDEDPEALGEGVDNLRTWLGAHYAETLEGYQVNNLAQATLDGLDGQERPAAGLAGAAITTEGAPSIDDMARALLLEDQVDIFPDTFTKSDRVFEEDPACFVRRDCEHSFFKADALLDLPLSVEMTTYYQAHYRWVEAEESGPVILTRTFLLEKPVLSASWITMDAQYGMTVTYPDGTGVLRLQAMWAQVQIINSDVSADTLVGILLGSLQDTDETMYAWIETNY